MYKAIQAIAAGGVAIGTLDLLFVWGFWAPHGATLSRILQSIAAGWYGAASRAMGAMSALVGAVSHYAIATGFVLVYWLLARHLPVFLRKPVACGAAYGLGLYAVMNFIVVPLSAAGTPKFDNPAWVGSSVLMHVICGVMSAWFAQRAMSGDIGG